MKIISLISFSLFVTLMSSALADKRSTPFAFHGSATRIQNDGSIAPADGPYLSPRKIVAPFYRVASKAQSPSAGKSEPSGFAKWLARCICPHVRRGGEADGEAGAALGAVAGGVK